MAKIQSEVQKWSSELDDVARNFADYHTAMETFFAYYKYSSFYQRKAGEAPMPHHLKTNFLKTFARKNILYTAPLPAFNVPTTGADEMQRQAAAGREKLVNDAWRRSGGAKLAKKWAFDGTVRSAAISEVCSDLMGRYIYVKRHNPLKCFWQISDTGEDIAVQSFWAVSLMTKEQCQKKYGVTPTSDPLSVTLRKDNKFRKLDGQEWFADVIRWDGKTRVRFVGDKIVEPQHNHIFGEIPVDICFPFDDDEDNGNRGAFYLEDLTDLQAELHDVIHRRSAIVRRMSNPATWARGVVQGKSFDDFQRTMESGNGGGFLALAKDGDVGILQLSETKMLDNHKKELLEDMQRIAGFSAATFGESVGANTSGDALGMYFTPTQKLIEDENINWTAFYQSINAKILKGYENMLVPGEKVRVSGSAPRSTIISYVDEKTYEDRTKRQSGGFDEEIGAEVIARNYYTQVIFKTVTPKNDIEEKRYWKEAVDAKFVSRTTAYEQIGLDSPEEELALLRQESGDPILNPEGTQKLMQSYQAAQPPQPTVPAAQPATMK